jgi:outer membrane protein OmpA-like peptidoglycan-associated protein
MPTVRNVPVFPDRDLKTGDSWTAPGEEAHDLRAGYGIQKPFHVPIDVKYVYKGLVQKNGKTLHLIEAEYTIYFVAPDMPAEAGIVDYPVTFMGYSKQRLYWDNELGIMPYYNEEFRIQIERASGLVMDYRGTAEATVIETQLMDRAKVASELNAEISRLGIKDASATATDEGVTISLENIQFEADSANLLPSEKEKINKLAALLERYPDKELLISGHTALAGTKSARQKLSEERADAVARFLVESGVREDYNVYTRGFGADQPLVPNDSDANRARNRRVEITILEK